MKENVVSSVLAKAESADFSTELRKWWMLAFLSWKIYHENPRVDQVLIKSCIRLSCLVMESPGQGPPLIPRPCNSPLWASGSLVAESPKSPCQAWVAGPLLTHTDVGTLLWGFFTWPWAEAVRWPLGPRVLEGHTWLCVMSLMKCGTKSPASHWCEKQR
jgi:hypothetical protein